MWGRPLYLPWLRGYPPSGPPPRGDYTLYALKEDLACFLENVIGVPPDFIGHDWGAILGYGLASWFPHSIHKLVAISVPPVGLYLRNLSKNPLQFWRFRYIAFFQLPVLPEWRIRSYRYLSTLIWEWSKSYPDPGRVELLSAYFQDKKALSGALAYYRHLGIYGFIHHPVSYGRTILGVGEKIRVPTLIVAGDCDGGIGISLFSQWERFVSAPSFFKIIHGCGHFLPLEAPGALVEVIEEFLLREEG
jgi:pimeloyl-ACP methyl ester carboxylesterase